MIIAAKTYAFPYWIMDIFPTFTDTQRILFSLICRSVNTGTDSLRYNRIFWLFIGI
jgi:hypothetical protein